MRPFKKIISSGLALCLMAAASASPLTAAESSGSGIVVEKLLENVSHSWDGKALVAYPTEQPAITLLKISVAPKTKLAKHYHSVINVGYMLEGELTVHGENGEVKTIKAGEPLVEMVGTIHYGENTGDCTAVIIVFYAGDAKTPITTNAE